MIVQSELKIRGMLSEKELILKEVHHRIKNNMNAVSGLLQLQSVTVDNPAAVNALNNAVTRIRSMMVLYDKLYRSDSFIEVSVKLYLPSLIDDIISNFPNRGIVKTDNHIDDFVLDVDRLVPLGIIINELVTNMMKYAFTGRESGCITISASMKEKRAVFLIEDNGNGGPLNRSILINRLVLECILSGC